MMILVSGATRTVERHRDQVGILITPRTGNSIERVAASGQPWAADNDAFKAWDADRYWKMIVAISKVDRSRLLWVTVPDVVADAEATINRWHEWHPQLEYLGLPCAFVAQDGLEHLGDQIPWDDMACLFIGGSTEWKLSEHAEAIAREAKRRGKLVHMGRVNSRRRIRHAIEVGVDTIDGRSHSAWPDVFIPKNLNNIKAIEQQGILF